MPFIVNVCVPYLLISKRPLIRSHINNNGTNIQTPKEFFKKDFIYSFVRERRAQAGGAAGREKQAPRGARGPMRDSIPGPRDHDLSRRQTPN